MLTKSVYKEYMAINFRICTNVFIGHTVHCRKWAKNLLHAVLFFSWAANERNCFFFLGEKVFGCYFPYQIKNSKFCQVLTRCMKSCTNKRYYIF